jgi:hypothetical protein
VFGSIFALSCGLPHRTLVAMARAAGPGPRSLWRSPSGTHPGRVVLPARGLALQWAHVCGWRRAVLQHHHAGPARGPAREALRARLLALEHFYIHAGGRGMLDELERNLGLCAWHMEPSRMTLYRFGNTWTPPAAPFGTRRRVCGRDHEEPSVPLCSSACNCTTLGVKHVLAFANH